MSGWRRLSVAAMTVWTFLGVSAGLFALATGSPSDDMSVLLFLAFLFAGWLTPPLLVFLLQWVTRWIYRGFRDH
jgi:hypothetical protein